MIRNDQLDKTIWHLSTSKRISPHAHSKKSLYLIRDTFDKIALANLDKTLCSSVLCCYSFIFIAIIIWSSMSNLTFLKKASFSLSSFSADPGLITRALRSSSSSEDSAACYIFNTELSDTHLGVISGQTCRLPAVKSGGTLLLSRLEMTGTLRPWGGCGTLFLLWSKGSLW